MMPKHAIIIISPEVVSDSVSVLTDHGLRLVRTLLARDPCMCAFLFEGDCLPWPEDQIGPVVVTPKISVEAYGRQRMMRVAEINVSEAWPSDVIFCGLDDAQ